MTSYSFSRKEHLKSRKQIALLFQSGKTAKAYPIKCLFMLTDSTSVEALHEVPLKAAFTIPKRNFRKAVHRNRIKRQIIETFRLNRNVLNVVLEKKDKKIEMMFVFMGNMPVSYEKLTSSMKKIIDKVSKEII